MEAPNEQKAKYLFALFNISFDIIRLNEHFSSIFPREHIIM